MNSENENKEPLSERRKFIIQTLQGVGLAALGAVTWSAYATHAKASPLALRPPGAISEKEFLAKCIKCGLCVEACPFHTLKLAKAEDNIAIGTPFFTPRSIPCYMCKDIPWVPPCPTGALDESLVSMAGRLNINTAKMGVAVIDSDQRGAQSQSALELRFIVHLDQTIHPQREGRILQFRRGGVIERRHDEKDAVGA